MGFAGGQFVSRGFSGGYVALRQAATGLSE